MHMDVVELRDFYADALGQMARRFVRRKIRGMWPDTHGLSVLGLGFTTPYLRPFLEDSERVLAFMPAGQGVIPWPTDEKPLTALVDEMALPLPDACIDRILIAHGLENSDALRPMMREIWRVLAPEGRVLLVVPNRQGLWARIERTPFGHGRPFSSGQLSRLLRDCMFEPVRVERALFMPPFAFRFMIRSAAAWEDAGQRMLRQFAGVLLAEASKRVVAIHPKAKRFPALKPMAELAGADFGRPGYGHAVNHSTPAQPVSQTDEPGPDSNSAGSKRHHLCRDL